MSRWGNEGQCTPTFTEEEKDDINGTYRQMFETMADLSYERINDLKNKKVWYERAKETDQKDLMAPGPIGPVTNAQIESSAPAIQPTIKSYERPSSLDTDQFIGVVAGGVLGGLALLGLIAVAIGPLVNDFFTNFWKSAGVLR